MTSARLLGVLALAAGAFVASPAPAQSLDEMAGQMIIVGFRGDTVEDTRTLVKMIGQGRLGGVMYLKTNVSSLDHVRAMNKALRSAGAKLAPFIALDQEGGSIERLTKAVGFGEISSAAEMARRNSPEIAQTVYAGMATRLAALGFNLNFGPVVDLDLNPANPIIGKYNRSYGSDPDTVVRFGEAFVAGHRQAHVLTALKHFPGHGSSAADSHAGFVDISNTWQAIELDPFRDLVAKGDADMVMVAHLYHEKFAGGAGEQWPASLSPNWVTGVLRAQLGYQGVVVTDDLEMGAIRKLFSFRQAIVQAVRAGDDLLLFSNTADYRIGLADEVRQVLVEEGRRDPGFAARIGQSYERIVALKETLG